MQMQKTKLNAEEYIKGSTILVENTDKQDLKRALLYFIESLEEIDPGITEKMTLKELAMYLVERIDTYYEIEEEES